MTSKNTFARDVDTGVTVSALDALKGPGKYVCIDERCGGPVSVHRGDIIAAHFAHLPNSREGNTCPGLNGGETQQHYDSKHFIAKNLTRINFVRNVCRSCGDRNHFIRFNKGEIATVEGVVEGTPNNKRRADVLVSLNNKPIASIEVLHTHRAGHDKRRELEAIGVAVIEIGTDEVITLIKNDHPDKVLDMFLDPCRSEKCGKCVKKSIEKKKKHDDYMAECKRINAEKENQRKQDEENAKKKKLEEEEKTRKRRLEFEENAKKTRLEHEEKMKKQKLEYDEKVRQQRLEYEIANAHLVRDLVPPSDQKEEVEPIKKPQFRVVEYNTPEWPHPKDHKFDSKAAWIEACRAFCEKNGNP